MSLKFQPFQVACPANRLTGSRPPLGATPVVRASPVLLMTGAALLPRYRLGAGPRQIVENFSIVLYILVHAFIPMLCAIQSQIDYQHPGIQSKGQRAMPNVQPVKGAAVKETTFFLSLLPTVGSKRAHARIRYSALRREIAMLRGRISRCQTVGTNPRVRLSTLHLFVVFFCLGLHNAKSISCLYQVHGSGLKRTICVSPHRERPAT
ncbi:hypothetical protein GGI43DRAFT_116227 [Trichoderma evansii]